MIDRRGRGKERKEREREKYTVPDSHIKLIIIKKF
jgi:hypothetical protein